MTDADFIRMLQAPGAAPQQHQMWSLDSMSAHFLYGTLRAFADATPPNVTIGEANNPYLRRWYLTPRGKEGNLYLHQFLRSDDDRALHDHPWASMSLLLHGEYLEHDPTDRTPRRRRAGDVVLRTAEQPHRIELDRGPCWSLFATGPTIREWGFHCPQGWKHWRDFTAGEHGETVGAGCG